MAYNSKYTGEEVEEILDSVGEKQDKLTAGENITISSDNVISASGASALWNTYLFENSSSGDSVVVIDSVITTIAAGETLQGTFTNDISEIQTNNLKRIVIRGDVSLRVGVNTTSTSTANTTLTEVDIEMSRDYSRSFQYMFCNLRGLQYLRLRGGKATNCSSMCYYVGQSGVSPCTVDIKAVDYSTCVSFESAFSYAKIASVDLTGADLSSCVTMDYCFYRATINTINLSGIDLSTCESATQMLYVSALSINLSGVKLYDGDNGMFSTIYEEKMYLPRVPAIEGQFGKIIVNSTLQLIDDYERGSMMNIFNALSEQDATSKGIYLMSITEGTYNRLTESDIEVATNIGWTVTVS